MRFPSLSTARFAALVATIVALLSSGIVLGAAGAPLILGQYNSAGSSSTRLTSTTTGTTLKLTNSGTGRALELTDASAVPLKISAPSGTAPMTVNSGTRVTNLNADRLDGKHASAFYTRAKVNELVFDQRSMVGSISATGTKRDSGAYTSSRSATGLYYATFETVGLGVSPSQMPPNVTATASWLCAGGTIVQADWNSYTSVGEEVTSFSIHIRTFDSAGVAADCATQFQLEFAPASSLAIPPPSPAALSPTGLPADAPVECRNEPDGVVCEPVT